MTQVSKLYHSREDRVAELHEEAERLQYDGTDAFRINAVIDVIDEYAGELYAACDNYIDSEDDREQEINRSALIERWALSQAALSKLAWVMRFDGNNAYERLINSLTTGAATDMRGL